jgi:hypothetical protein
MKDENELRVEGSTRSLSPAAPSTADISDIFEQCLASYRELLAILNRGACRAVEESEIEVTKALEGYGQLRSWGEETRAVLPAASRGSLDNALRKNIPLKTTAVGILEKLHRQLEFGKHIYTCSGP